MLSEISQTEKDKLCANAYMWNLTNKTNWDYHKTETDSQIWKCASGSQGEGSEEGQDRGHGLTGTDLHM